MLKKKEPLLLTLSFKYVCTKSQERLQNVYFPIVILPLKVCNTSATLGLMADDEPDEQQVPGVMPGPVFSVFKFSSFDGILPTLPSLPSVLHGLRL